MTQQEREDCQSRETNRNPSPATAMPVHQRSPEPFQAPGETQFVQLADIDQARTMNPQKDRNGFIHESEREAGSKGQRCNPAQANGEGSGEGGIFSRSSARQTSAPNREQQHHHAEQDHYKAQIAEAIE